MKYVEVVKAVREEQMKKEASVKELAGLLKKKAAEAVPANPAPAKNVPTKVQQTAKPLPSFIPANPFKGLPPAFTGQLMMEKLRKRIEEKRKQEAMLPKLD